MKKTAAIVAILCVLFVIVALPKQSNDFSFTAAETERLDDFIPATIGIVQTKQDKTISRSTNDFSSDNNMISKVTGQFAYSEIQEHSSGKAYKIITSEDAVPTYSWVNATDVYEITADASPKRAEVEQFTLQLLTTLQKSYETLDSSALAPFYNTESSMYEYEMLTIEKMTSDERKIRIVDFKILDVLRHGDTYWPIVIVKYHRYWPGEIRRSTYYEYSIYNVQFHNEQPRVESLQLYFR